MNNQVFTYQEAKQNAGFYRMFNGNVRSISIYESKAGLIYLDSKYELIDEIGETLKFVLDNRKIVLSK